MTNLKDEIINLLHSSTGISREEIEKILEVPPDQKLGDFAFPCFILAKKEKKSPVEIAKQLASEIKPGKDIKKIEAVGPYVNFFISTPALAQEILSEIWKLKDKYGCSDKNSGKRAIIDMVGLNPNKTPHIGHIRTGCVGDTVANLLQAIGYEVTKQSFINDMGMPTASLFWALKNIPDQLPEKKGYLEKLDHWYDEIYLKVGDLMEEDPEIKNEVKKMLAQLQARKDPALNNEQRSVTEKCIRAQNETWSKIGVWMELMICESDLIFSKLVENSIQRLKDAGAIYKAEEGENAGCQLLKLGEFEAFKNMLKPDKILIRSDGTSTYTANDIGLHFWKFGAIPNLLNFKLLNKFPKQWITLDKGEKLKDDYDLAIDIIGAEQSYAMSAKYHALKAVGSEKEFKNSYHLPGGLVGFAGEAKISSRKGSSGLSADEIFDRVTEKAYVEVDKRQVSLDEDAKLGLAKSIGIGAVRYWMIRTDPKKFIIFDWDKALEFEGNTGPHMQYSLVRAKKILQKISTRPSAKIDFFLLVRPEEKALLSELGQFPAKIEKAATSYSPNILAEYALKLSATFNVFYERCPVMRAESKELLGARLLLVWAFMQTLKNSLKLLGIEEVDVM